ncbi:UDP-N-acetylglucosamine transferase subunit alg14 [Talaromyces islandicus]|uniref:UDP-N-acetylglucosamine transferase subunit alg14 n=1 Tax=Talaromyces islandicus TaxID=28573 RepID=A0A0U1LQN6_TALIS|nr:UDP-N-acetylglucosamine transferase subunit alg14 [Talaromyces islandicus]
MALFAGAGSLQLLFMVAAICAVLALALLIAIHYLLSTSQLSTVPKTRRKQGPAHLLVVLGSGGHTAEMLSMLRRMPLDPTTYTFRTYIVTSGDAFSASKAVEFESALENQYNVKARDHGNDNSGPVRVVGVESFDIVTVPRARRVHQSFLTAPLSTLQCFWACIQVLCGTHPDQRPNLHGTASPYPDLILTNGPATAVGLGAVVSEKFAAEGANVAISYASNADRAKQTAAKIESKYNVKTAIFQGDAGKKEDSIAVVRSAIEALGGLDVVVSNAGYTKMSKFDDLYALEDEDWDKCWAVNVKGHMYTFREALPTFNKNPEGGVFIITSSVAGLGSTGSSMAYAVAKSASIHLAKCLAKTQGPKARVHAVCPGLLLTEWADIFPQEVIDKHVGQTPLQKPADLEDTADLYISLAKNSSMTGQVMAVDSGFALR